MTKNEKLIIAEAVKSMQFIIYMLATNSYSKKAIRRHFIACHWLREICRQYGIDTSDKSYNYLNDLRPLSEYIASVEINKPQDTQE